MSNVEKIGIVTLKDMGDNCWHIRLTDPATGRDVRRRLNNTTKRQARRCAAHLAQQALAGRGLLPAQLECPTIMEGVASALRVSRARDYVQHGRLKCANRFSDWLASNYPEVSTWAQLQPTHVQEYIIHLERRGLAYDTVRLAVAPIKLSWKYMTENFHQLVGPCPRFRQNPPVQHEIECLDHTEVGILLDWLKAHAPDIWPIACLQALCGLRMLEAAALRINDIDLKAKTITITDTGHHEPKTRGSYRTIPVCDEVLEAIKSAIATQNIKPASGEIFTNNLGNLWVKDALTHRWRKTLNRISAKPKRIKRKNTGKPLTVNPNGLDMPQLGSIPARKLRASFATMAGQLGAQDRLLKAYLGHSSGDILGGHYRRIELSELRSVSTLMNGWRKESSWQHLVSDCDANDTNT